METKVISSKNGVVKQPELKENLINAKVTVAKPDLTIVQNDVEPLEDRLLKLSMLFEKQKKYQQLQNTLQSLEDFKLNSNDKIELELQDDHRRLFSTKNKEVITEVLTVIKTTVLRKIKELEPQLSWF